MSSLDKSSKISKILASRLKTKELKEMKDAGLEGVKIDADGDFSIGGQKIENFKKKKSGGFSYDKKFTQTALGGTRETLG